jgi:hypothetical protein
MFVKPMRMRRRFLFASLVVTIAACGSRTGLLVPLDVEVDASVGDAGADGALPSVDGSVDATEEDARAKDAGEEDALPSIDVRVPEDVVVPSDCPDASATFIYVISDTNHLYSFYPPSAELRLVGTIACPIPPPIPPLSNATPFSMAVDHTGIAYVVFSDGELFRVSTATAACEATPFVPRQHDFADTFGMGFSQNTDDAGETLYIAADVDADSGTPAQLATIDVTGDYALAVVGDFNPSINRAELTGTGAGDLFGFWNLGTNLNPNSAIVQIDKATAQVTNSSTLAGVEQGFGWAFAFWGGDFYTFTAPSGSSTVVQRFRPSDGSIVQVLQTTQIIVGAGVSTCAPQH